MKSKKVIFTILALFVFLSLSSFAQEANQKRFFLSAEAGYMLPKDEGSYGSNLFGRVGFVYVIIPEVFDIYVRAGVAPTLKGDPWKTIFQTHFGFTMHYGPGWLGFGTGYNSESQEERDKFFLHANIGLDVFTTGSSVGSIFFEVLHPMRYRVGEGLGFTRFHKLLFGIKFLF